MAARFVLVHGAWHGGWCWQRLAPLLEAAGHTVIAPTLTGLAERATEATPLVGLSTHVEDVLADLEQSTDRPTVLVGHSYGASVVAAAAHRANAEIARVVYLDGFVPATGESQWDLMASAVRELFERSAEQSGDGWLIPPPAELAALGLSEEDDRAWVASRLTPHPLRSFREPLRIENPGRLRGRETFVFCVRPRSPFQETRRQALADPLRRVVDLPGGHDVMVTEPGALAEVLLREASLVAPA